MVLTPRVPTRAEFEAQCEDAYRRGFDNAYDNPVMKDRIKAVQNELAAIEARTDLTAAEKRRLGQKAIDALRGSRRSNEMDRRAMIEERERTGRKLDGLHDLARWFNLDRFVLQRPDSSYLHHLLDAIQAEDIAGFTNPGTSDDLSLGDIINDGHPEAARRAAVETTARLTGTQTFLIQHDWATAFEGASEFDEGGVRLPYEACVFEFLISGRRIVALVTQTEDVDNTFDLALFLQTSTVWIATGVSTEPDPTQHPADAQAEALLTLIRNQIRAVSIALEAEAAATEIVRAPHKLNKARAKRGAAPLVDFHLITLGRRTRPPRLTGPHGPGTRKRLHFRRGHWRHYEHHKTWIKWMLVGDPDLGFVDKEYRL